MSREFLADILSGMITLVGVLFMCGYIGLEDVILNINTYGKMACFVYLFLAVIISTGYAVQNAMWLILEALDIGDPIDRGVRF